MNAGTPTVFLVDDDASFLAAMERLMRAAGYPVAGFTSAADFLTKRPPRAAGCIVADLQMPGMDGIALQEALAQSGQPLPVIFLTGQGDIPSSVKAMRRGAEDFLTKTAAKEELFAAIERALARDARDREMRSRFERLTRRERDVLAQVLRGQLNKQIAARMGIDERSVKRHRTSLMAKLQVRSVAELAQLAVKAQFRR
jgi:FixJ family two-component response regulator